MKLAVIVNLFDGEELLEGALSQTLLLKKSLACQ
jgi:hypothetical protein